MAGLVLLSPPASAQYPSVAEVAAKTGRPLPPFLAAMKRHNLKLSKAGRAMDLSRSAGLPVGLTIIAGGAKVRDYTGTMDKDGATVLYGIP